MVRYGSAPKTMCENLLQVTTEFFSKASGYTINTEKPTVLEDVMEETTPI